MKKGLILIFLLFIGNCYTKNVEVEKFWNNIYEWKTPVFFLGLLGCAAYKIHTQKVQIEVLKAQQNELDKTIAAAKERSNENEHISCESNTIIGLNVLLKKAVDKEKILESSILAINQIHGDYLKLSYLNDGSLKVDNKLVEELIKDHREVLKRKDADFATLLQQRTINWNNLKAGFGNHIQSMTIVRTENGNRDQINYMMNAFGFVQVRNYTAVQGMRFVINSMKQGDQ